MHLKQYTCVLFNDNLPVSFLTFSVIFSDSVLSHQLQMDGGLHLHLLLSVHGESHHIII